MPIGHVHKQHERINSYTHRHRLVSLVSGLAALRRRDGVKTACSENTFSAASGSARQARMRERGFPLTTAFGFSIGSAYSSLANLCAFHPNLLIASVPQHSRDVYAGLWRFARSALGAAFHEFQQGRNSPPRFPLPAAKTR